MARRSQCSDAGDNPLDPNYLPPHYREEYRLAIDSLIEEDLEGYYKFLQVADVVDFLSPSEIDFIQNSVQLPNQSSHPEHHFLDPEVDGSSDTYWPLHSDLDAPGLDLGWPQIHHFIGPTEVTTLVNPAAPDMPSIKEQARRLIKNAQMVIAIVMDMFTDVDIFSDILSAAMRNVAVYILLDEANVQHFVNMVNNCRVNLQSIQFLRVRTVSGITYHCRSGKSFKGQMLDRFLLTDCRAVLSGNYSFMWSYEKLHRCMAHLFLGQLVSTFDEEFRILFALSEPLIIENTEDFSALQQRPYLTDRPMFRDTRKYRSMDPAPPEEWPRQAYDEMDWRMTPLKRQETFHGPMEIYGRFQPPQTRLEPPFEQGPPRMPMMEGLTHKRHSFAEGAHGRYNLPYQQRLPDVEPQGRPFYRGQQLQPGQGQGPEPDYGVYDKFWNQDFQEQYPEPGYPPEMDPQESYDPVLNYLSSTRNIDTDQSSDKLLPAPFGTCQPQRLTIGQSYACQTSPTPSNTTEKKFPPEHVSDRKDPKVKRGLRNWRISSFLSACEDTGEPEGLPMAPLQASDPFEEPPYPTRHQTPPIGEIPAPKIPNVREFKVPALPRVSQLPTFAKTTPRELPKKPPDELPQIVVDPETKTTPSPSESSSTTDGDKQEEAEQKEPKAPALRREESFRRNYNAAVHRSSRLRSSLIFSSLEQENKTAPGEQEEDGAKTAAEQTKLPFVSQVLTQRRSLREPFEWKSYIKTNDNSKAEEDSGKATEKDSTTDNKLGSQEAVKPQEVAPNADKMDVSVPSQPSQTEQPKTEPPPTQQPQSFTTQPFLDMNDPDQRFLFFKELAAKRKAEKAAEAEKAKLKPENTTSTTVKKDEPAKEETAPKDVAEEAKKTEAKTLDVSAKPDSVVKKEPASTQSCEKLETKVSNDSEKISTEKQTQEKQPSQDINVSKPAVNQDKPSESPVAATQANVEQVTEEKTTPTSKDPQLKTSKSVPDFNKQTVLDFRSSHLTPRIYERSALHSQDAPSPATAHKESQQKSRLWTPTLHKREPLKPFIDSKQKSASTVIQIEEPAEETTQTSTSDSENSASRTLETVTQEKSTTSETDSSDKSKVSVTQSEQSIKDPAQSQSLRSTESSAKDKPTVSPSLSDKTQPKQTLKEASVKSPSGVSEIKEGTKEPAQSKPVALVESPTQDKTTVSPCVSQSLAPSQDEPKTEPKQSHDQTVKEKLASSVVQVAESATKEPSALPAESVRQEKSTISQPISERIERETAVEEKTGLGTKTEESTKEVTQKTDTSLASRYDSKDSLSQEKSSVLSPTSDKIVPDESVSQSTDESKQKSPVIHTEEFTQPESHSNTSSPASYATALEFISSEETDLFSPGRTEPQHLFRRSESGQIDFHSNASDSSDFETPSSDLSRSPMLFMINKDEAVSSENEATEDNISIAETVIEVSPRKENDVDTLKSDENQPPQEPNPTAAQSEAKTPTQGAPTHPGPPSEATASDSPTQNETAKSGNNEKIDAKMSAATNESETKPEPTQTELNKASVESKTSPFTSQVDEETKMLDKTQEDINSESDAKAVSSKTQIELNNTSVESPTSPATSQDKQEAETPETTAKETPRPADRSILDDGESESDQIKQNKEMKAEEKDPPPSQPKQSKPVQSRYLSSTANVISSSNLRDDTKILLEQISANSQSRNESNKEAPVTDDEKEDEADKNSIRKKDRLGQQKPSQDREKVLERIQTMRKDRKVYSRFEL